LNHTVIAKAADKTIIHLGGQRHYGLTGSANKIVNSLNVTQDYMLLKKPNSASYICHHMSIRKHELSQCKTFCIGSLSKVHYLINRSHL